MPVLFKSEYLSMRLCLAEVEWIKAVEGFRHCGAEKKLEQLKKVDLLAWEIEKLKEGRI